MNTKEIDAQMIIKLEESKRAVLNRVAERLKNQVEADNISAAHSSHSSSPIRTHAAAVGRP